MRPDALVLPISPNVVAASSVEAGMMALQTPYRSAAMPESIREKIAVPLIIVS